jgi:hypothetical protein
MSNVKKKKKKKKSSENRFTQLDLSDVQGTIFLLKISYNIFITLIYDYEPI